ncbi:MAG TPA: putative sugar nucleotidyl transferase [Longimicrobiaceae bacterium]|nr:putative sugar nucleotidyl transferase [Longimicrobiaceae bacterium]
MTVPSLVLFDDLVARRWEPFALTRPAGELLFGALTLRARAERVTRLACTCQLAADHLLGFTEEGAPPVAPLHEAPAEGDRLFWLSRAVPAWETREAMPERISRAGPVLVGGEVAGWYAPSGSPPPPREFFDRPVSSDAPVAELPGRLIEHVWEIISALRDQLSADIAALHPRPRAPNLPEGAHHRGAHPLVLGAGTTIEPETVFDTSEGPIWLDDGVEVQAFTRLGGPAYVGRDSRLLGGALDCVAIGPVCRVHGQVGESVCLGYTNKQHDGHLGHAYLGRWVNLGAETTNSDLKNNYGTVRLWTPEGEADTGEVKMGCLLGDHVKTGIGLLINTGTVVGAGSNLFGAGLPPKYVPPFSWGSGADLTEFRLDKFLEVAERAMERRGVTLTAALRDQLTRAWRRGRVAPGTW